MAIFNMNQSRMKGIIIVDILAIRKEIQSQRRKVDFDNYDITIDELIRRVERGRIEIAPSYQRQFRWNVERQSALIESLLLGIPVPSLFMATNSNDDDGLQWEIVDGLQRTLSLVSFAGTDSQRAAARLVEEPFRLKDLQKLKQLNGLCFQELPLDIRDLLLDRPVRITVLNDKSDKQVRFDLFERLNTGGISLTDQEVRECVFRGPFIDMLQRLSEEASFRKVVRVPSRKEKDGTLQECVLRFFAFYYEYNSFNHSVKDFLNAYTIKMSNKMVDDSFLILEMERLFRKTFDFLAVSFPEGLTRSRSTTPINYFEGVSVGAALALDVNPRLRPVENHEWLNDDQFVQSIVGATNSLPKVRNRIELARDGFLNYAEA